MIMVRTFTKMKLFVEFASLNSGRAQRHSRWNAAAKVNLLWFTKNVLLNGLASEVTKFVKYASEKFKTFLLRFYEFRMLRIHRETVESRLS